MQCKWNTSGTVLAVAGNPPHSGEGGGREISNIGFYDAYGKFIRTLKVSGGPEAGGPQDLAGRGMEP